MGAESSLPVILFIGVNPKDTRRLRLDDEAKRIKHAFASKWESIKFIHEGAVTADELRNLLLRHTPRLIHLSGHGGPGGFKFENERGTTALVPADALAELFALCRNVVRCVVLNACSSGGLAAAIGQYIPYVIGMSDDIGDDAALNFTSGFYAALASDRTYNDAFEIGRNAINLKDIPESLVPVLKAQPGAPILGLFEPKSVDLLLAQYRAFVLKDLTISAAQSGPLPSAPVVTSLRLRVVTSSLSSSADWSLPETMTEENLVDLCHAAAGQQGARLIVSGEPGAGKTLLLQRAAAQLARRNPGPLPLYLPLGAILKEEMFVTRWLEQRMRLGNPSAQGLSEQLTELGVAGQLVILADGIDALSGELRRDAMIAVSSLVELWPRAVFLLAARPYTMMQIDGPPFIRLEIRPLSREQQVHFLSALRSRTRSAGTDSLASMDEVLREIAQNPSLRDLAATCLGLAIIAPLTEHRAKLARGPLLLLEQFIRFLLAGRSFSAGQGFPHPEATLAALRLLAFKLTSAARDTVSLDQLEGFLYDTDADAVRQQLERHTPWREGGVRAFLHEQADKLGILGPYERTQDTEAPRWRFVHDAFCDALAAAELKSRCNDAGGPAQVAALVDRSRETAPAWYEPVTLLVADTTYPDELAKQLSEANPALGMRLLHRVPHLSASTIFALLGARGDWQQRVRVFARISELLGDPSQAVDLLDRIRCSTRNGNDLYFIDRALDHIASAAPELAELVADRRREIFAHIPRPLLPLTIDTPSGGVPLFCAVPPGEVDRAPGSEFPRIRSLHAVIGYQLSCVPITRALFSAFDPAHGPPSWRPKHPAVAVTWYEATMFCRWLGTVDTWWEGARLPREAEWEYACLYGASGQLFCCGDVAGLRRVAWYRESAAVQLRPVARLQPSRLGLYDLHGNVREWCEDLWEPTAGEQPEIHYIDPRAVARAEPREGFRGLRGGCFLDDADALRVGARAQAAPSLRSELFGFRVLIPQALPTGPTAPSAAEPSEPSVRVKT